MAGDGILERLDRTIERNSRVIEKNSRVVEENSRVIGDLRVFTRELVTRLERFTREMVKSWPTCERSRAPSARRS